MAEQNKSNPEQRGSAAWSRNSGQRLPVRLLVVEQAVFLSAYGKFGSEEIKHTFTLPKKTLSMAYTYMTKEGYDKLVAEINELESVQRPEISRQIAEARDKGDLSENAEYDAAKEAQGILETKISQLKLLLSNARIIDESMVGTETVQILNKVTIKNLDTKAVMTYTLVSDSEANIKEGKMSVNTPIAQGLMGKKVGDKVEIKVPSGTQTFEIMEISL